MSKHKLVELQKVIDEKIGSLKEEVEIGTNVKLNPLLHFRRSYYHRAVIFPLVIFA
jgi:hypothetical protein